MKQDTIMAGCEIAITDKEQKNVLIAL